MRFLVSEVPLYIELEPCICVSDGGFNMQDTVIVQGYLAHKKTRAPRTLQSDDA